jgi:glycosyltransferase involved in cell wall biosynthesis
MRATRTHTARVGFLSTRLAGTDGVSLEAAKWETVLRRLGHACFAFAGACDWPADRAMVVPEAHFAHPEVQALQSDLFDDQRRTSGTSRRIQELKDYLKQQIGAFVRRFDLDILVAENALSIPMHVPLGLALAEFVAETAIPVIAHHHDLAWERERFTINAAGDLLRAAFPPVLLTIHHVVINSFAAKQIAMRTGERSVLIPNVMDFDTPPPEPAPPAQVRQALGVGPDERFLLQPTRVVPRKRIEQAIELARRLALPCALVISHASGDEGDEYAAYLRQYADLLGARVIFAGDRIGHGPAAMPGGLPLFSLADVYHAADLVTYPSALEGFGNAFLEAIYYRRPIIMRSYDIFQIDIKPKGFRVLTFGDFIPDATVEAVRALLRDPDGVAELTAHNYEIGRRFYSFSVLENQLRVLMNECFGT